MPRATDAPKRSDDVEPYVSASDILAALADSDYATATRLIPMWIATAAVGVERGGVTHTAAMAIGQMALALRRAIKAAIEVAANAVDEAPMTAAELAELAQLEVEEQSGGRIRLQIVEGGRGAAEG